MPRMVRWSTPGPLGDLLNRELGGGHQPQQVFAGMI